MALAVTAAALLRPLDAAFLTAGLLGAMVAVARWRDPRRLLALGAGLGLGLLPWVVEAMTSYGGLLERLRAGARVQGSLGCSGRWAPR